MAANDMQYTALRQFFKMESSGGIVLMIAAVLAMVCANSTLYPVYDEFLSTYITVTIGGFGFDKNMLHFINDGLMAVFFLLIGLEIKREFMEGELSSFDQAVLPIVAAAGGVVLPALIFMYFNQDTAAEKGWAIPAATDIAFALGVLSLFGKRVPLALKVFLMAVAVIDDLAAIVIIALFYTSDLSVKALEFAMAGMALLLLLNSFNVRRTSIYIFIGIFVWLAVLKSGVHATIAGVIIGFMIPHKGGKPDEGYTPLRKLEHALHFWVAFAIMPVFAFANAGVNLDGMTWDIVLEPVPIGIALGLIVGKQIGIFAATWVLIKSGLAKLPKGVRWRDMYGVCILAGIGFTMSLFIGGLAFDSHLMKVETRVGVLGGSIISGILGYIWLTLCLPKAPAEPAPVAISNAKTQASGTAEKKPAAAKKAPAKKTTSTAKKKPAAKKTTTAKKTTAKKAPAKKPAAKKPAAPKAEAKPAEAKPETSSE